jgi:hypothetical protein
MFVLERNQDRIAGPLLGREAAHVQLPAIPFHGVANATQFAQADARRQSGHEGVGMCGDIRAALHQRQLPQLRTRANAGKDFPSASRVKAIARQLDADLRSHARKEWQIRTLQKLHRRRHGVMGIAADADGRGLLCMEQWQHERLQDQRTAAGTADREMVSANPGWDRA